MKLNWERVPRGFHSPILRQIFKQTIYKGKDTCQYKCFWSFYTVTLAVLTLESSITIIFVVHHCYLSLVILCANYHFTRLASGC